MFKKILQKYKEFNMKYDTSQKQTSYFLNLLLKPKVLLSSFVISNGLLILYFYPKYNSKNHHHSYSRYISRKVGDFMTIRIPESLREPLYSKYIKLYNVNTDDILEKDLKKYENLKDFFTRKINVTYL